METRICVGGCVLAFAASCSVVDDNHRIDVTEANALGVTMLQTERDQDHGNAVFTLRALSASNEELASVRLMVGAIPDLAQLLPGAEVGSEIAISVPGGDARIVSRETQLFQVQSSPGTAPLLELASVKSVLEQQANLIVLASATTNHEEAAYLGVSCSTSYLLTTPVAEQCCYNTAGLTMFVRPSDMLVTTRVRNPSGPGTPCKASDGVSACAGAACYYGPFGFARPSLAQFGPTPHILTDSESGICNAYWNMPSPPLSGQKGFTDKSGTNSPGVGCPGGATGAGDWDY